VAKLDDIKAKARAGLAAARRGIASGARSTALGAKRLGRRASAMSSAERRAFCARTAPERGETQILAAVNRALRMAFKALDKPAQQIETAADALRIGAPLRATLGQHDEARLARLAGEAAVHAGFAMQTGSSKEWAEAGEYADDAIDLGGSP
jgi:hypothetical protein